MVPHILIQKQRP